MVLTELRVAPLGEEARDPTGELAALAAEDARKMTSGIFMPTRRSGVRCCLVLVGVFTAPLLTWILVFLIGYGVSRLV